MKIPNLSQRGYTLIEMMLVLALTAMLALSGTFVWRHYQHKSQLEHAARQIADFMQRLQCRAAWGNHHYRIRVRTGLDWSLEARGDAQAHPMPASAMTLRRQASAGSIRLEISTPGYLILAGLRNTATPAHLTLSNPAGRIRVILSGKGRVRVCSEHGRWAGIGPC
ncbi:prepilin-type N-terminal cleavage/methylation domain-containing protein [Sodalis sp. RH22]|uniref:prepilin-type N-terminal cleavage/methylation domain-containing protein n=1 Tax=unclassified Sodalis (in: enterobacteria) TaxID=2636512 RepID=UPI0039B64CD7